MLMETCDWQDLVFGGLYLIAAAWSLVWVIYRVLRSIGESLVVNNVLGIDEIITRYARDKLHKQIIKLKEEVAKKENEIDRKASDLWMLNDAVDDFSRNKLNKEEGKRL